MVSHNAEGSGLEHLLDFWVEAREIGWTTAARLSKVSRESTSAMVLSSPFMYSIELVNSAR